MPNVQEFLKDVATKAKIDPTNPDFATVIGASGLKEIELPPAFVAEFHKHFLTRDAAKNDKDIFDEHERTARGKFYGILDNKVGQFLTFFGDYLTDDQKNEITKAVDTPTKFDLINKYLPGSIQEKIKVPATKHTSEEEKRRLEEDYNKKVKAERETMEKEWSGKLQAKQKEFEDEQISNFVTQKIFSYNLQDKIAGGKEYLATATINKLQKLYYLKYENGVGVHIMSKDDPEKNVFVNNEKLTLDAVLNDELRDYVKKSNAENGNGSNKSPFAVTEKPVGKLSLQELNRIAVQAEAAKLANQYKG
jgi:hypothetical protein